MKLRNRNYSKGGKHKTGAWRFAEPGCEIWHRVY